MCLSYICHFPAYYYSADIGTIVHCTYMCYEFSKWCLYMYVVCVCVYDAFLYLGALFR